MLNTLHCIRCTEKIPVSNPALKHRAGKIKDYLNSKLDNAVYAKETNKRTSKV